MERVDIQKGIKVAKIYYQVKSHPELSWDPAAKTLVDNSTQKVITLEATQLEYLVYTNGKYKTVESILKGS